MADAKSTDAQQPEGDEPEVKETEKKPAAKKPAAKEGEAKKPAAKKPAAKKAETKKPAAKKPAETKTPAEAPVAEAPPAEAPAVAAAAKDADAQPPAQDAPAASADAPAATIEGAAAGGADVAATGEVAEADEAGAGPSQADVEAAIKRAGSPGKGARYTSTGKRKTSVARVILTPGDGSFWVNGRSLEEYFPRHASRTAIMEPLLQISAAASYQIRARIHGGGVSSQAGALRHGIARALADIDPLVRTQLKSRGMLKLDARQVERKKAGLKKARKRPQFSKR